MTIKNVIDRSTWRFGGSSMHQPGTSYGPTRLLNNQGYMCCLGQFCINHGISKKDILNITTPYKLQIGNKITVPGLEDVEFCDRCRDINDRSGLTNSERENKLIKLAAENDQEWSFVGEYK